MYYLHARIVPFQHFFAIFATDKRTIIYVQAYRISTSPNAIHIQNRHACRKLEDKRKYLVKRLKILC